MGGLAGGASLLTADGRLVTNGLSPKSYGRQL